MMSYTFILLFFRYYCDDKMKNEMGWASSIYRRDKNEWTVLNGEM